jgi:hypothetical protein
MRHGNRISVVAVGLMICLLSAPGCRWQQGLAQQRAARAAALAERDALQAEAQAALKRGHAVKGSADATCDIGNDALKLKEYPPTPSPAWHEKYVKLLKERCNVEWEVVQGPAVVSEALVQEVAAYNELMRVEVERRFGDGILLKLQNEAEGK